MSEPGRVRRAGGKILVYMRMPSWGPIRMSGGRWIQIQPLAVPGLDEIAEGTIIDPEALVRQGCVVVVREAPTHIDDATLLALELEAEAMGRTEQ